MSWRDQEETGKPRLVLTFPPCLMKEISKLYLKQISMLYGKKLVSFTQMDK